MKRKLSFLGALLLASTAMAAPPAETETRPAAVSVQKIAGGYAYADAKGMVLYTYDADSSTPGSSACTLTRHCQLRWPPLYAEDNVQPVGDWTIIKRPDGKPQWAYKNKPVYRYLDDLTPASLSGDNGGGGRWHALVLMNPAPKPQVPAGFQVIRQGDDWFYADHEGRRLYSPASTKNGVAACDPDCLKMWRPVRAGVMAASAGTWSVIDRKDGIRQWALAGAPLYTAVGSSAAPEGWQPAIVTAQ